MDGKIGSIGTGIGRTHGLSNELPIDRHRLIHMLANWFPNAHFESDHSSHN